MPILDYSTVEKSNEGSWMNVKDPETGADMKEGEDLVRIKLAGVDSKIYREAETELQNLLMERALSKKGRKVKTPRLTPEERCVRELELAIKLTLDWENVVLQEGEKAAKRTDENVRLVYENVPEILEQVYDFVGDRANFLKK